MEIIQNDDIQEENTTQSTDNNQDDNGSYNVNNSKRRWLRWQPK